MGVLRGNAPATAAVLACAIFLGACGGDSAQPTTDVSPSSESGTVSARSKSFQKYSGKGAAKLHLAEFGTEASPEDRIEAQSVVDAFLQATGKGEWSRACGYLSGGLMSQFDEIARRSKGTPKPSCGEILQALAQPSGAQSGKPQVYAPQGLASLRIKEGPGGGFALFRGSDGEDHWMAMKREAGEWGVLSITPQPFS
jgi:hypothetical protein